MLYMVDVAHWDVPKAGFDVAAQAIASDDVVELAIKVSEGVGYVDSSCRGWVRAALSRVPYIRFYHFGTGRHAGVDQWSFFKAQCQAIVSDLDLYMPFGMALDWEHPDDGSPGMMPAQADAFLRAAFGDTGVRPHVYGNQPYLATRVSRGDFASACPLWLAGYENTPKVPRAWPSFDYWQYTDGVYGPADVKTYPRKTGPFRWDRSTYSGDDASLHAAYELNPLFR